MKKMSRLMAFAIVGIVGTSTIQALTVKERVQQAKERAKEWSKKHEHFLIGTGIAAGAAAAGLVVGGAGIAADLSLQAKIQGPRDPSPRMKRSEGPPRLFSMYKRVTSW